MILDATGDLENVPRHTEALMFAIYFLAVNSLGNDECQSMFGEPRATLLTKYDHGTQQALTNARFLRSLNIFTLQALIMFLVSRSTLSIYYVLPQRDLLYPIIKL